jgi:ABC-2 type transport system permease protein
MRTDWTAVRGIVAKDLRAVMRSKSVIIPMLAVPVLLMVLLPGAIGLAARATPGVQVDRFLADVPGDLARPILDLPVEEQIIVLVNGYLLAPLFLIVPLMVSAVLAADAFAGEKERRTLESLLHSPIRDRDLFLAKFL